MRMDGLLTIIASVRSGLCRSELKEVILEANKQYLTKLGYSHREEDGSIWVSYERQVPDEEEILPKLPVSLPGMEVTGAEYWINGFVLYLESYLGQPIKPIRIGGNNASVVVYSDVMSETITIKSSRGTNFTEWAILFTNVTKRVAQVAFAIEKLRTFVGTLNESVSKESLAAEQELMRQLMQPLWRYWSL